MPSHFQSYAANFNRVRLHELIDHHATLARHSRVRPSLIVNPLTGRPYSADCEQIGEAYVAQAEAR